MSRQPENIRVLLLSDTHGHLDDEILRHAAEADEIWHAGDIGSFEVLDTLQALRPTRAVWGNIDEAKMRRELPENQFFECLGLKVFMTHIGGYPGRYPARVKEILGAHPELNLSICGHSHILKVMPDKQHHLLHMNPGACGMHGFHRIRTMLRFKIEEGQVRDLAAIEMSRAG